MADTTKGQPSRSPKAAAKSVMELSARKKKEILTKARGSQNPMTVTFKRPVQHLTLQPADLDKLVVDHRYQRPENRGMVNQLVAVLEAGGKVPDPITLVERPDGTRVIVDGQQRWAAHYLAQKPLDAMVYSLGTLDEERKLFSILNNKVSLAPGIRVRAWQGPAGVLIRRLNEESISPLQNRIGFTGGAGLVYASTTVLALCELFGAGQGRGGIEDYLRMLDRAVTAGPDKTWRASLAFAQLIDTLWRTRPKYLWMIALGMACHEQWKDSRAYFQPDGRALTLLKSFNWDSAAPSARREWADTLKQAILKRWKVKERD